MEESPERSAASATATQDTEPHGEPQPPEQSHSHQQHDGAGPQQEEHTAGGAPQEESAKPLKGTGVFHGPVLAARLAGQRHSAPGSNRRPAAGARSTSFSGATGGKAGRSSAPGAAAAAAAGSAHANSNQQASQRRASMDAFSMGSGAAAAAVTAPRRSSFSSVPGDATSGSSSHGYAAVQPAGAHMVQLLASPAQPFSGSTGHVLIANSSMPSMALGLQAPGVLAHPQQQLQQQQQMQALSPSVLQLQEQQHMQEMTRIQLELQHVQQQQAVLQQQQLMQQRQQARPQEVRFTSTSSDGVSAVLSCPTSPLGVPVPAPLQQHPSTQPIAAPGSSATLVPLSLQHAQLSSSQQSPFAIYSSSGGGQSSSAQLSDLSVSSLGPAGLSAGGPSASSMQWPADCVVPLQSLHPARMPLQQQGSEGAADAASVAALDGQINELMSRLLNVRSQITARRAAEQPAAAGGPGLSPNISMPAQFPAGSGGDAAAAAPGMMVAGGLAPGVGPHMLVSTGAVSDSVLLQQQQQGINQQHLLFNQQQQVPMQMQQTQPQTHVMMLPPGFGPACIPQVQQYEQYAVPAQHFVGQQQQQIQQLQQAHQQGMLLQPSGGLSFSGVSQGGTLFSGPSSLGAEPLQQLTPRALLQQSQGGPAQQQGFVLIGQGSGQPPQGSAGGVDTAQQLQQLQELLARQQLQ